MVSAKDIYTYIDTIAPFGTAMSFDNVGLLVGSDACESDTVLLALDATKKVLEEAVSKQAAIIVTHHPVIFDPLRQLLTDSIPYLAARHGITIISAHTNLDIARGGVNDSLAAAIGVAAEETFDDDCALVGVLPHPFSCKEFAGEIKNRLGLKGLRFTDTRKMLQRVVVSCGAGGGNLTLAEKLHADALITGEIKHHLIHEANDHDIAVFDLGHFQSEGMIIPLLVQKLQKAFPEATFLQAEADTDGVLYYV